MQEKEFVPWITSEPVMKVLGDEEEVIETFHDAGDGWFRACSLGWSVKNKHAVLLLFHSSALRSRQEGEIRLPLQCSNQNQDAWHFLLFSSGVSIHARTCPNSPHSCPCSDSLPVSVLKEASELGRNRMPWGFDVLTTLRPEKHSKEANIKGFFFLVCFLQTN